MIAGAAICVLWCGYELWCGYRLLGRRETALAQTSFQAATFAGFLTIGFVVAAGAIP